MQDIGEIGEKRRAKLFRPDTARVIKPRDPDEVGDTTYTEADRAAYLASIEGVEQ